ncbi:hypothetical protein [Ochrobactrum quorumnocens]|uniref:Uncharacterized protein n=1 Tax=Ochrobactrum quorumnocens TaxID=271865 RepID=A0A5N1K5T5_9HYPH|nr:hypothetical protein [[Ochrobactrum] quorumnocens]KAA9369564.1 hypothetical protein F3W84_05350 [[Ochrobactrum] quorumnocens]
MKIEQRFNGTGWAGIAALFLGPCLTAFGYWNLIGAMARNVAYGAYLFSDPLPWILVMIAGSIVSLLSLPMIIIGRDFEGFSSGLEGERARVVNRDPTL